MVLQLLQKQGGSSISFFFFYLSCNFLPCTYFILLSYTFWHICELSYSLFGAVHIWYQLGGVSRFQVFSHNGGERWALFQIFSDKAGREGQAYSDLYGIFWLLELAESKIISLCITSLDSPFILLSGVCTPPFFADIILWTAPYCMLYF